MMRFLKYLSIFLTLITLFIGIIYYFFPSIIVQYQIRSVIEKNQIHENSVQTQNYLWYYYEAGQSQSETIILLHGYGASKADWISYIIALKNKFFVLTPDLPGFGKTKIENSSTYSMDYYAKALNEFILAKNLSRITLIGLSMGGTLAGYYAALFPERVNKIIMVDPGGISSTTITPYWKKYLDTGLNELNYKNNNQFNRMIELIYDKPIPIPFLIKNYAIHEKYKNYNLHEKIFSDAFRSNPNSLGERLDMIKAPALVLWGENDQIFDVSATELIRKKVKNSQVQIIENTGHIPIVESPQECFRIISDFLGESFKH